MRDGWDQQAGRVDPKSRAGTREVPVIGALRDILTEHRALTGRDAGLVCGRSATVPFCSTTVNDCAPTTRGAGSRSASTAAQARVGVVHAEDALAPIGLHEARHTFAWMIAAGVDWRRSRPTWGTPGWAITATATCTCSRVATRRSAPGLEAYHLRASTAGRLGQDSTDPLRSVVRRSPGRLGWQLWVCRVHIGGQLPRGRRPIRTRAADVPDAAAAAHHLASGWQVVGESWVAPAGEWVNSKNEEWVECPSDTPGALACWRLVDTTMPEIFDMKLCWHRGRVRPRPAGAQQRPAAARRVGGSAGRSICTSRCRDA